MHQIPFCLFVCLLFLFCFATRKLTVWAFLRLVCNHVWLWLWRPRQGESTWRAHRRWHALRPINWSAPTTRSSRACGLIPGFRGGCRDPGEHLWLRRCFRVQVRPRRFTAKDLCPSLPTPSALHAILHIGDENGLQGKEKNVFSKGLTHSEDRLFFFYLIRAGEAEQQ